MIQNPLMEKKNTAFEKLSIATENHDKDEDQSFFYLFKSIALSSIDDLRSIKIKKT